MHIAMPLPSSFFQALYDASPNPYLILDRNLNIASANRAYLASTKRELDDIVGRWAWDAFPTDPQTLEQAIASFERVIHTGKSDIMALLRFDIPRAEADGGGFEVRYWSITHSPVLGPTGEVEYVLQHPIDVTELERLREVTRQAPHASLELVPAHSGIFQRAQDVYEANLNLIANVNRLQSLFQQAPSFMAVLRGPDHVFELVNTALIELMGTRDYIGKPVRDVLPELIDQGYVAMLDRAYQTGEPMVAYGKEIRFQPAPGMLSDRVVNFIYQPISDAAGKVEGIFVEGSDVTEQYTAQRMRDDQMRLEARHKDEFLAMLAHELRNPLAPITSAAYLLGLSNVDQAGIAKASAIIRRQASHMRSLIDDLLDVSRVSNGLVSIEFLPVDVSEVIQEAVEQVHPLITMRRHRLEVQIPDGGTFVFGDRKRLVQVVANLLTNAAKYTHEGGAIELRTAINDQQVVLSVSDNGIGMTPDVQKNVFGLFTQAERTPDRTQGGLGIGLALVKNIVELHHGSVMVASPGLGQGATLTVMLPKLDPPGQLAAPASPAACIAGPALNILVVDDNVDAAELLAMSLVKSGYKVEVEHSAVAALERVRTSAPDVFLLDIGMPNIDGNQLARELRRLAATKDTTLIAVTGYGTRHDRLAAVAAGFNDYFVKPVDIPVLLDVLSELRDDGTRIRRQ
jgi:signal transduction histidine kinase/ActR/RegA family two-component response regulator